MKDSISSFLSVSHSTLLNRRSSKLSYRGFFPSIEPFQYFILFFIRWKSNEPFFFLAVNLANDNWNHSW
jgi:hypothetical protein